MAFRGISGGSRALGLSGLLVALGTSWAFAEPPRPVGLGAELRAMVERIVPAVRLPPRDAHDRFLRQVREAVPERLVDVASRLLSVGDFRRAVATANQAAGLLSNPFDLSIPPTLRLRMWATSRFYAGQGLAGLGNGPGARAAFGDVEALVAALLRQTPGDRSLEQLATAVDINAAGVELASNNPDAALRHYQAAKRLLEQLVTLADGSRDPQQTLAGDDRAIGELQLRGGDTAGAIVSFRASHRREAMLLARDPRDVDARLGQARSAIAIADVRLAAKDLGGARAGYDEANQLLNEGGGAAAASLPWRYTLAETVAGLASVAEARGDMAAAADGYRLARDDFLAIVPLSGATDPLRALGSTNFHLANVMVGLKDTTGALDALRDAIDAFTGLLTRTPGDRDAQSRIVSTFGRLAELQAATGDPQAAVASFVEVRDMISRLLQLQPGDVQLRRDRAISDFQIAKLLTGQRDVPGATAALRGSLKELQALVGVVPTDVELRRSLWTVAGSLGGLLEVRGDLAGALAAYRTGAAALSTLPGNNGVRDKAATQALAISADRISSVGYTMVLAHDDRAALAAQDDALVLAPGTAWIEANRAHALMLLGRTGEARAIYLAHRDAKFPGNVAWIDGVRSDFAQMRKAGASAPLMDEIEKAFAAPKL